MASFLENFELGAAGVGDLWVKGLTLGTYNPDWAASVYTSQTVGGAGSQAERDRVYAAAQDAEEHGVLGAAAAETANDVAARVSLGLSWAKWALIAGVLVAVGVVTWRISR